MTRCYALNHQLVLLIVLIITFFLSPSSAVAPAAAQKETTEDEVSNTIVTLSQQHTIHKQQEAANAEARRLQDLADASTGTVAYDTKESAPVSCNEIMAKAVVVASEEKEKAFLERNGALAEARRATERANTLAEKLEVALEDAKNATIEYEAVKLMTDRLVDEVKKNSIEALKKKDEEHLLAIQKKTDEMQDMERNMHQEIDEVKAAAAEKWDELQKENSQKIQATNLDANQRIAQMEDEVKAQKEKAQKDVRTANKEAQEKIQSIIEEYKIKEDKSKQITSTHIQTIQNQATQEINDMKKKVEEVEKAMQALNQSTKEKIDAINIEKDEKIRQALIQAHRREEKAMEKAYQIENDAEKQMEQLRKEVSKEIAETHRAAQGEYDRLKKEVEDEIKKIVADSDKALDEKEKQIMNLVEEKREKEAQLQDIIKSLRAEIDEMKNQSSNLDTKLSSTNDELEYWKEVGMNPVYVNTTLIMKDATTYLNRTSIELKQKANKSFEAAKAKVQEVSKPHIEKATKSINQFYDEQIKESVETTVLPLYKQHIMPLQEKLSKTYEESIIPLLDQLNQHHKNVQEQIYTKACDAYKNGAQSIRESLEKKALDSIPKFFFLLLKRVESSPATYLVFSLKILAIVNIYLLRYFIVSLVWNIVTMPFRIIWFFCPLRLIVGGGGGKKKSSKNSTRKGSKRMKEVATNGYSGVVKEQKANGAVKAKQT